MSTTTPNLGLFKYNPTTDANLPFNIVTALNNNWDILDSNSGSRNIGEIVASTIPLTDAGLHLLDGSLIQGSGIYSAFVTYIAGIVSTYPDLFVTESEWQQSITDYDVCGKFVYNSTNNTVRLPKITGIIEGTTDLTALGDLVEAGLPNLTGSASGNIAQSGLGWTGSGVFSAGTATGGAPDLYGGTYIKELKFDASHSNSIYGNSTTVQPQTIKVLYYIVVATTTKTDIQVDIDEIAADLNGKVNTSDLQEVQCIIETYSNGNSWYRVYSDGWCEQGGRLSVSTNQTVTINFLKPFVDTNYIAFKNLGVQSSGTSNAQELSCFNFTTTTMQTQVNTDHGYSCWQAIGYIEV